MTYKGIEIGDRPTGGQVEEHIREKGYSFEAFDAYKYWAKKDWKSKKGYPISSVESAMAIYNSFAKEVKARKLQNLEKQQKKKTKSSKKATKKTTVSASLVLSRPINYKEEYAQMLKDPRWYAFRSFIFTVRGTNCECCGSRNNLQVHHIKYVFGKKPWEYTCNEVEVLCRQCHAAEHGITEEN